MFSQNNLSSKNPDATQLILIKLVDGWIRPFQSNIWFSKKDSSVPPFVFLNRTPPGRTGNRRTKQPNGELRDYFSQKSGSFFCKKHPTQFFLEKKIRRSFFWKKIRRSFFWKKNPTQFFWKLSCGDPYQMSSLMYYQCLHSIGTPCSWISINVVDF